MPVAARWNPALAPNSEPFSLITFRGKGPVEAIDLDRTGKLLEAEDWQTYGQRSS